MCNAYNHSPGCMCGWGGEGHLGHSYGGGGSWPSSGTIYRSYDSERSTRWHNQSMSELATELGHSLLFPVNCRYCGRLIYLFADPNGGFVIFNDVGKPWPKHQCRDMPPGRTSSTSRRNVIFPTMRCPFRLKYRIAITSRARDCQGRSSASR